MRVLIAAGLAAAFTSCSVGDQVTAAKGEREGVEKRQLITVSEISPRSAHPEPEIVTLRTRSGKVTIYSSVAGPLFTIAKEDGTVEAEALSYVELEARYPDLYRTFRSSIAEDGRLYAGWYDPALEASKIDVRELEAGPLDARVQVQPRVYATRE